MIKAAVLGLCLAAASACTPSSMSSERTCDPGGQSAASADYSHFIRHDGALYVAPLPQALGDPVVGRQLGTVVCTFDRSATPLSYRPSREGEAGFVPEGTPYFAINGCPEEAAIAASWQGQRLRFIRESEAESRRPSLKDLPKTCA